MWNERYDTDEYVFGKAPADFLPRHAYRLAPGMSALVVADGEGRNAVWLAEQGLQVTAFDAAPRALDKARRLARERGVAIEFHEADILEWNWSEQYDVVVAIFIQFSGPRERERVFAGLARAVRSGGLLMLHGYAPRQVDYGTGGPPHRENMYTESLLRAAFQDFEILELADYDMDIHEGSGHSGRSALVDLIARKPETA